ncbi:7395_t:CDS:1, partial [Racocetra fulgida]
NIKKFRNITNDLENKIDNCPNKEYYQNLQPYINKLCSNCYMTIIDSYNRRISTINRIGKSTNLIKTNKLDDLIEINEPNLMEVDNLIEINNNLVNLIELIETQKKKLIKDNITEINQQFIDIKVNITNDIVSIDKENFDQLINLIIQKDLKIETLTN